MTDTFTEAMRAMTVSMQKVSEAFGALGAMATDMTPHVQLMAYQSAVMRDCLLTDAEKEAQEDALWECQALSLRLAPRVFEKTYTMFGTTMLEVTHGLFTREVLVEAFIVSTTFDASVDKGLKYSPIPPEAFHVIPTGVNTVSLQFVGHTFRKPPYTMTTQAARSAAGPAGRVKIRVTA